MKSYSIALSLALGLGACSVQSDEDQLENTIRETLSKQGEVQQVELNRQENGSMTGFAVIRERNGRVGRLTCTAEKTGSETKYNWKCSPAIDEQAIKEMEDIIRAELSKRGPVLQLEMKRQGDDNHMSGFAVVHDEAGEEFRLTCSATRSADNAGSFTWKCGDESEEAAPEDDAT
jgi:hypothetical protein